MILYENASPLCCAPYEKAGAVYSLSGFPALRRPCFFLFEPSAVMETQFTLPNSCRNSAAIIGAMQLTITDLHFVHALANLGWKILKLA